MKTQKILPALALLVIAACPLVSAGSSQCYSYPVSGNAPGALGESLESEYQMRFHYAQEQGAEMQKWHAEPVDTFRPLLGTRATMLQISNECFTRAVDAGTPGGPLNLRRKVQRRTVSAKAYSTPVFNIAGQKSTPNKSPSSSVLFEK